MIPQEYIQEVVRRNDIEEVIGQYVQLRRRGRTLSGLCPFHNEKTPSFVVYPDTQSFYCFGCGAAGDVINFVRKYNNLGYVESVKQLAARAGMPLPEEDDRESRARQRLLEINRCAARYFYENLNAQTPEAALARKYWKEKRGLSDAAIRRFGLGYAPNEGFGLVNYLKRRGFQDDELEHSGLIRRSERGNLYTIFRHRVMVPIIDVRGAIIAFGGRVLDDSKPKYINSPETMVYHKSHTLFALNIAKKSKSKRYILCEGYMDVIAMHEAGFDTAVCACGTALTAEQAKLLSEYADEVVLSYDSDEAGQKATERSLGIMANTPMKVSVLSYQGAKDPDEFIKKYGSERFRLLLEQAGDAINFRLDRCENGLDTSTESGKVQLLKRVVSVLAEIQNPLEREVYLSRTANKWEISAEVLHQQVDRTIRSKRRLEATKEWKDIIEHTVRPEPQQPQSGNHLRERKAEERILFYILSKPEESAWIVDEIKPEQFSSALFQQVLNAFQESVRQQTSFSLSSMGDVLSEGEMGKLSGIAARNQEVPVTKEEVQDCIRALHPGVPETVETNDDLLKLIQKKQHPNG